jgi:carbonic anhydrase/acetyltransferase-like protein (isoleucine patch superfamily)
MSLARFLAKKRGFRNRTNVQFGPSVQLYTAHHPVPAVERIGGLEFASPIRIGKNYWLGGGAIVCPGVSIGENTTIGAGSVVVRDTPERGRRGQPVPGGAHVTFGRGWAGGSLVIRKGCFPWR